MTSDSLMNTSNTGKSGGDAKAMGAAGAFGEAGQAHGDGHASVVNVDPVGAGEGIGGDTFAAAGAAGCAGAGDVADNTSIGSINIS